MSSGVAVNPECIEAFNELKKREVRGIVLKINDEMTEIGVEKKLTASSDAAKAKEMWGDAIKELPESDCRFVVYDFEYEHQGLPKSKLIFVKWAPEAAKIKAKMIYASSQEGCLTQMEGVGRQLQCTDEDEAMYETIVKTLAATQAGY
mmetsp:Transcript_13610/g.29474  ORF Transcript_13610/g.29474 Transcript_13610/m.29474 type:complete len:148 (-) Transcript_13610:704-1147(-)|eukprot:CAMPEP_0185848326 /NCGR_PEP_ID=MMETSP1354-20130828/3253_1 /TAXON_ID=708628 /ORGANISM="Erythrolobus madagascarensis, Strain CCMP3276" /LENGTH=147 /DNA_ID=CAMNT_0028548715 /DNA_START=96 /DNA_END=539 /DNA_ORIENTATION=-